MTVNITSIGTLYFTWGGEPHVVRLPAEPDHRVEEQPCGHRAYEEGRDPGAIPQRDDAVRLGGVLAVAGCHGQIAGPVTSG